MTTRFCNLTLAFVALMSLLATPAIAADSVDGTIESLTESKISIKDKGGKLHTFEVDGDAEITLDGKTAKLDTLGVGSTATVSTESKNNKTVAVKVHARSKLANGVLELRANRAWTWCRVNSWNQDSHGRQTVGSRLLIASRPRSGERGSNPKS